MDTQFPEIKFKKDQIEIKAGDHFDPKFNINTIKDPVDGELDYFEKLSGKVGAYTIENHVNATKAGKYQVKVIARDFNGNQTEKEFTVTVKKKEESKKPSKDNSNQQPSTGDSGSSNGGNTNKPSDSNNNGGSTNKGSNESQPTPQPDPEPEKKFLSSYATQVLEIVNQERAKEGLLPLAWDADLASATDVRAKEIVTKFSHTRPDGSDCFTAVNGEYGMMGENIAAGQPTPEAVMIDWMNSQGHRENILTPEYNVIGISCYLDETSEYGFHWVQMFGKK